MTAPGAQEPSDRVEIEVPGGTMPVIVIGDDPVYPHATRIRQPAGDTGESNQGDP